MRKVLYVVLNITSISILAILLSRLMLFILGVGIFTFFSVNRHRYSYDILPLLSKPFVED